MQIGCVRPVGGLQMSSERTSTDATSHNKQAAAGLTRRGAILAASAAASASLLPAGTARAAIVRTDPATLPPLPLPPGVRSRYVADINGLNFHVLEAGFEDKGKPCILLLHGYPEIAFGWRKVMPRLAAAGFHVLAPDMRGYGRTTGWDDSYESDVFPFRHTNLVRDALGIVAAFGYQSVVGVVGRDAGSPVAAYCALMRPDVFRSVAMMTSPFAGPPALPFNTVDGGDANATSALRAGAASTMHWRSSHRRANTIRCITRHAAQTTTCATARKDSTPSCAPTITSRARTGRGTKPFRLKSLTAEELGKMPHYYIMELDKGMAETVAEVMPSAAEIAACKWLTEDELAVYTAEYARTGFQGGLKRLPSRRPPLHGRPADLFRPYDRRALLVHRRQERLGRRSKSRRVRADAVTRLHKDAGCPPHRWCGPLARAGTVGAGQQSPPSILEGVMQM